MAIVVYVSHDDVVTSGVEDMSSVCVKFGRQEELWMLNEMSLMTAVLEKCSVVLSLEDRVDMKVAVGDELDNKGNEVYSIQRNRMVLINSRVDEEGVRGGLSLD